MRTNRSLSRFAALSLLCLSPLCLSMALPAAANSHVSPARVGELVATVQALLDAVNGAPGDAEVRRLLDQGRIRADKGDLAGARTVLQQAYEDATRLVIGQRDHQTSIVERASQYPVKPSGDRALALAQARIEAIRSLLDAYRRIAPEKGGIDREAVNEVTRRLELAQAAALAGDGAQARLDAEASYAGITNLVTGVRNGDKLIKTLAFDSPADEYRYELDRFASYRMLLTLAVAEEGRQGDANVSEAAAEGERIGAKAAQAAEAGDWPQAIRLLEQATASLVKAIRATGRFVPS